MFERPLNQLRNREPQDLLSERKISTVLFEGTEQELYDAYLRYRFLFEFARILASQTHIDQIIDTLLDGLISLINAERCLMLLFGPEGEIIYRVSRHLEPEETEHPDFMVSSSIIAHVRESQKPVCIPNVLENDGFHSRQSILLQQILSVACIPINTEGHCIGILYADNQTRVNAFKQDYCEIMDNFVGLITGPLASALKRKELETHILNLQRNLSTNNFPSILGISPALQKVLNFINQVADTTATVILEGESGTGKELVARALHDHSRRNARPFVSLNCGALTETLLESELFGHIKGAFTGAIQNKKGWFETANGGTIFFDEISEMSPGLQVKLLRILQTGEYSPVGSNEIKKSDVRIIVATNRHLESLVKEKAFRSDLYYRLNILYLYLPPLRERREDILLLANHFLKIYGQQLGKENLELGAAVEEILRNHDFPGNIRELENIMQRAAVMANEALVQPQHLPESLAPQVCTGKVPANQFGTIKKAVVERFEREYFESTLERADGIVAQAARLAGIDPKNFYQKMQKYHIKTNHR